MRFIRTLASIVIAIALVPPAAGAAQIQVLGNDGTVYRLLDDTYGNLFPAGNEANGDSRVLALEVVAPDKETRRLLVPETASRTAELAPQLVYEQKSGTIFLLWEGIFNQIHPLLYLASFDNGGWRTAIEITGDPFARKGQPRMVATRDLVREGDEPGAGRTTLHVVWWEETAGGTRKRYTPIVIENGVHREWQPTWDLSTFVADVALPAVENNTELVHVTPGPSNNSVLVGFLTTGGDRVVTLEIELLPAALSALGDQMRVHIIESGLRADPAALANALATAILETAGFHQATLEHIAEQVHETVSTTRIPLDSRGVAQLGDQIRAHIIESGARIATHGLASGGDFEIVEVERENAPGTFHTFKVTVVAERPAPANLGADAEIFLSADGANALLGWHEDDAYVYVESTSDGWSEPRRLPTGDSFDADTARQLLTTLGRGR